MNTAHRRREIVSILSSRRYITERELAWEFNVCVHTIGNDIRELSFECPIYTKQGKYGGVFMAEHYKPYMNTLSPDELNFLCGLYEKAEEKQKELLYRIIRKYGPDKLLL